MELKDTIDLMLSDDFKDRFKAEYWQAKIRRDKLRNINSMYKDGTLSFKPNCTLDLLKKQEEYMSYYLDILKTRATIEGVNLGSDGEE